jgi:hypothetical protein
MASAAYSLSRESSSAGNPDVSDQALADALTIVIAHLEKTIYSANGMSLFTEVHRKSANRL